MKKMYQILVTETYSTSFEVEAESAEEAKEIASDTSMFAIDTDYSDF